MKITDPSVVVLIALDRVGEEVHRLGMISNDAGYIRACSHIQNFIVREIRAANAPAPIANKSLSHINKGDAPASEP